DYASDLHAKRPQHVADMVCNRMVGSAAKQKPYSGITAALKDQRSRIAVIAEHLAVGPLDDDLVFEGEVAGLVLDDHVCVDADNAADGVAGGAAELVHHHVDGGIHRTVWRPDVQHLVA